MKYWTTLTQLETSIIELDSIRNLHNIVSISANEGLLTENQVNCAIAKLDDMFVEPMNQLNDNFQLLWDLVRTDSHSEESAEDETNNRWGKIVDQLSQINNSVDNS